MENFIFGTASIEQLFQRILQNSQKKHLQWTQLQDFFSKFCEIGTKSKDDCFFK